MEIKIVPIDGDSSSVFIYIPGALDSLNIERVSRNLENMKDFKDNYNYNEDRIIRKQKWYHVDGSYFCPKWKYKYDRWNSHSYDDITLEIQNKIQKFINGMRLEQYGIVCPLINSCLINMYRSGNDYIRPHQDTSLTFGENPTIIGLSIGDSREILFKRVTKNNDNGRIKPDKQNSDTNFKFNLESGSIFIMAGSSQTYFTHEIPRKENANKRYSLTFRQTIF